MTEPSLPEGAGGQESSADWQTVPLAAAGFRPDLVERIVGAFDAGKLEGLHGIVVARHGKLVCERYFSGTDRRPGGDWDVIDFDAAELHDLRSVTKSIVGLLYGIALEAGFVPPPDSILVDAFPDYPDLATDPARRRLTVARALSMTLGTEWDESSIPYPDPRNSETAMGNAPDRYRFILERPIVKPPGESWTYCGGATALLGHLIAEGSGMSLHDFAKARLFVPLGISKTRWKRAADGHASAPAGLRMAPTELAKIGQLIVNGGRAAGRQLVPKSWLETSLSRHVPIKDGFDYGYQWYLGRLRSGADTIHAIGNGGQRMMIVPALGLVVVVTAGNYNRADGWKLPVKVITEYVLAGLAQR